MKKRITKKRFKPIVSKLQKACERAKTVERWVQLHNRHNRLLKCMNDALNKKEAYLERGFKPVSITILLKLAPWWKDQVESRQRMIMGHASFCCPISGEILDMRDSFIICNRIVSSKGIDMMIEKKGLGILGGINT